MRALLFCLLLAAQLAASQEAPPVLRLPDGVRPLRYAAELTLRPQDSAFRGAIEIEIEVTRETPVVWLNARFLQIDGARIGQRAAQVLPGGEEFVGLRPEAPLAPGRTTIRIEYRGELSARDSVGAFRIREAGDWYVYTQLESIFARRVFPCFDEPAHKVPWQLTLEVPVGDVAVSNTPSVSETLLEENGKPGGMKRVRFAQTRPLPSYLIAFGVGPFDIVEAGKAGRGATPLRILAPRGQGPLARYAAQVTPRLLELTEDYAGIAHPYEKLDSLAVPRPGGAMENPGLITYASNLILARPQDETPRFKQAYAHVAAHEIAHLWFGDLVTHAWWDDLWLNESFATWLSDKTIERFAPGWDIRAKSLHERNYAMKNDALASARRIRQPIESNGDILNAFDPITYAKGGAVLGMFERWLGEERFRQALRQYLASHADGVADATAFLAALTQAQPGAGAAFETFLEQAGLPLLSMDLGCGPAGASLRLEQRRYVPLGSGLASTGSGQIWQLPVCVRYGTYAGEDRLCAPLQSGTDRLALGKSCPSWIAAETARYYRVEYRGRAGARPAAAPTSIAASVAEIGDLDALARSGALSLDAALARFQVHAAHRSRDVAQSLMWALADLRPLVDEPLRPNWERWLTRLFGAQLKTLGLEARTQDSDDTLRLRPALAEFLAVEGNDTALQARARDLALRWLEDRDAIDGTMVDTALQAAARGGDRELFERMRAALAQASLRERRALYSALGSFADASLARAALALLLDPALDFREASQIAWAMASAPRGSERVFAFTKENFDALVARAPRDAAAYFPRWAGGFCSETARAEVEAFFRERAPRYTGGPRILAQTLERIDLCVAFRQGQKASLNRFLANF
jgi:alanyl aminopeptidase